MPRALQVATRIAARSGLVTFPLTFYHRKWCGMSPVARAAFIPILVLLRHFLSSYRERVKLMTFDLWRHRACRRCGSLYSIRVQSLKFVFLPIPKIRVVFCYGDKRPGDLNLWPFDFESDAECHRWHVQVQPFCQFWYFCDFFCRLMGKPGPKIYFVSPWHDIAYLCWKCRKASTNLI